MSEVRLGTVRRIESSDGIPDGDYDGYWSGYTVQFETVFGTYEGKTVDGIRGIQVPCTVHARGGQFTVSAK